MNDAASQFAKSSGKLIYVFNPRANTKKEEQVSVIFFFLSKCSIRKRYISRYIFFERNYQIMTDSVSNELSYQTQIKILLLRFQFYHDRLSSKLLKCCLMFTNSLNLLIPRLVISWIMSESRLWTLHSNYLKLRR